LTYLKAKQLIISLSIGFVGALLALGIWHIYSDHVIFHNLVNSIIQQSRASQNQERTK